MKNLFYLIFTFCVATALITSCGRDKVYQERKTFNENTWDRLGKGKTIEFKDIAIEDTSVVYDVYVTLRHTPYINERKVKFLMKIVYPQGIVRESVHTIELRDKDNKDWVGDAMGDMIDVEKRCRAFVSLPEKGNYTITITNLGTYSKTVGLMDMGIIVKKSNLKEYQNE